MCVRVYVRSFVLKVSPISHSAMPCSLFWSMHPAWIGSSSLALSVSRTFTEITQHAHTHITKTESQKWRVIVTLLLFRFCVFPVAVSTDLSASTLFDYVMIDNGYVNTNFPINSNVFYWFSELWNNWDACKYKNIWDTIQKFLRLSNNHVKPQTQPYTTCEFTVLSCSSDSFCWSVRFSSVCFPVTIWVRVYAPISDGACVTSAECEQRVERFLSCLRDIAVCCVQLTSFNPTEFFKRPCKTASPSGSCTVHTGIIIMLTCVNTIVPTMPNNCRDSIRPKFMG